MAYYFQSPNRTSPTLDEITSLSKDLSKNGFVGTMFESQTTAASDANEYLEGEKMKAFVDVPNSKIKTVYDSSFPFPKGDTFGICNNFKSAHFFMSDEESCT